MELSERYARENKLTLVRNYSDLGVSAYRSKNRTTGALSEFIAAVDSGRIERGSILLCESLDRLSRDKVSEALIPFLELLKRGIVVVTLQDGRKYDAKSADDPFQLMGSLVIMARANEESETKAHRSRSAWKARRVNRAKGQICPHWLTFDGTSYEAVPARRRVVERIFDLAANQRLGAFKIAQMFGSGTLLGSGALGD
jgi:DNA invertase Pin-like site-specific DNA recombinase